MAMFELNNSIKFLIPAGFNFSKDINKDGNEYLRVEFSTSGNGFTGVNSGYNVINVEYDYFGYAGYFKIGRNYRIRRKHICCGVRCHYE